MREARISSVGTYGSLQSAHTRLSDEMLAILQASQTLSSETDLSRLKARVVELLAGLTGATRVQLISHDADAGALVNGFHTPREPAVSFTHWVE